MFVFGGGDVMKEQIVFIDRPSRHSPLPTVQQFSNDLIKLRKKYGDDNQVIVRAIMAAEKVVKENESSC